MHIWYTRVCSSVLVEVRLTSQRPDLRWNLSWASTAPAAKLRARNKTSAWRITVSGGLDDEQIDECVHRRRGEASTVERQVENSARLLRREAAGEVGLELLHQQRNALLAAPAMADGILDDNLVELAPIVELDGDGVGDRALVGIEVVLRETLILDADHLRAQSVDPRIGGHVVLVVRGGQAAEDQRHGDHVLNAMVAVGRVGERGRLVDDADR